MSTLMSVPLITISVKQVAVMPVFAILNMNGLGMTTVMVSVKSTATLMKASGLAYATSCVLFVAFTRNT